MQNQDSLINQAEAEAFIGKKSDYYLEKWGNPTQASHNWAAYLGGIGWLLYRKMYIEALVLLALWTLLDVLLWPLPFFDTIDRAVTMGIWILVGTYGNTLYHRKFLRVTRKGDHLEGEERLRFLNKKGGTSILAAVVLTPVFVFLSILVFDALFPLLWQ